jgi:hypothetical protein
MSLHSQQFDLDQVVDALLGQRGAAASYCPTGTTGPAPKGPARGAGPAGSAACRTSSAELGWPAGRSSADQAERFVSAEEAGLWHVVSEDGSTSPSPRQPQRRTDHAPAGPAEHRSTGSSVESRPASPIRAQLNALPREQLEAFLIEKLEAFTREHGDELDEPKSPADESEETDASKPRVATSGQPTTTGEQRADGRGQDDRSGRSIGGLRLLRAMTNVPPTNVGPRFPLSSTALDAARGRVEMPRAGGDPSGWLKQAPSTSGTQWPNPRPVAAQAVTLPRPAPARSDKPTSGEASGTAEPDAPRSSTPSEQHTPDAVAAAADTTVPSRQQASPPSGDPRGDRRESDPDQAESGSKWSAGVCGSILARLPRIGARRREIDARLARVIDHWPELPRPIQAAILAMVESEG